jgi:hypothetical protein
VATPLEPAELDRLVAFAECARVDDWSLRSALCRYAQPQPVRVGQVLDVVRRTEFALARHAKRLAAAGPALWAQLDAGTPGAGDVGDDPDDREILGLLDVARQLDRLGDLLASWAVDRSGPAPEADLDQIVTTATARLDALGIPREDPDAWRGPRRG